MKKTITNPVIKDQVTFTQTAQDTSGRITSLLVTLMPGGGTPLHYHKNFDETFVVVEGVLTLRIGREIKPLYAGQKLTVQPGQVHRFSNETDMPVAFTTVIVPGSTGFEYALRILYGLAADGETDKKGIPRNIITLAAVSAMSDMHPAGAGRLISPLFGLFNRIAKQSGITNKLIDRYCK